MTNDMFNDAHENGNGLSTRRGNGALNTLGMRHDGPASGLFMAPAAREMTDPALTINSFLRWKWTILGVFSVVAVTSFATIWTMVEPLYSSTAVVRVASSVPRVLYKTEDNGTVPLYNAYINTQVSVIQSPEVLSRVFKREDVRATEWFKGMPSAADDPARLIDKLVKSLAVTVRRGTELIDVAIETRVPTDAAVIVNAVAEEYKAYWDEAQAESERQRLATLREQLVSVQRKITELFEQKFSMAEKMGTTLHAEVRSQMLGELRNKRTALEMLRQEQKLRMVEAKDAGPKRPDSNDSDSDMMDAIRLANVPAEVQRDPMWLRHQEEYVASKKRLDLARRQFGEAHPSLQSAIADVELARRMLRLTEQRLGLDPYSYSGSPQLAEHREAELEKSIDSLQQQLADADGRAQELARTDEMYAEQKLMRKDLMDRLNALETESNAPARISIQSPGLRKLTPSSDRRLLMSACALVLAALAGLGVGYVRGRTDPTIHQLSDLGGGVASEAPFLGQLPRARNILELGEDTLLGQAVNENIRIIRTMLLQRLGGSGAVVITSPEASSGKTSVAVLLGRSLAAMGKKVLLVDVDLLHPSITQQFNAAEAPGLRAVLLGKAADAASIVRTDDPNLDVLPIGKRNGTRDNDILAQGTFPAAIQRWKSQYDVVLLDSPPVLSMADARITAAHADGAVMVLRSSGSKREDAVEAFAGLSATGARLLGTLLVGVSSGTAYYPYYYRQRNAPAVELLA